MFKYTLRRDYETRSAADLKKVGVQVYAADPSSDVWCLAYAVGDNQPKLWVPGMPVPDEFIECAENPEWEATAWNDNFERNIEKFIMGPKYGFPEIPLERQRCTMVQAMAMGLPGSLENAAGALGLDIAKDMAGQRLMLQLSRPRKRISSTEFVWWDDKAKLERLYAYCLQDVRVEAEADARLLRLRPFEQKLWHIDQTINDRGVPVDEVLCHKAKLIAAQQTKKLDARMREVTDMEVASCNATAQLIAFLRLKAPDLDATSVAKDKIDEMLAKQLPDDVRAALELRKEAAKASVAKIDALLNGMNAQKRACGLLQYHAASTGRWGGRRFQPQNLPRTAFADVDAAIECLMTGDAATVEALCGPPLSIVSDCIRGMIKAEPGKKLVSADYSNIEGRVLAWLAGEEWKLDAFREYDAGTGPDLYKLSYGRAFGITPEAVDKSQRQIGKVMELALGYQGGVGAFQTMAVNYGLRVSDDVANDLKEKWRKAHPGIVKLWHQMEGAAIEAVKNPGEMFEAGKIKFKKVGSFLFMRLPSGRNLSYAYPSVVQKETPFKDRNGRPVFKDTLAYMGVNSYTRKWEQCFAYGGLLVENATQAVARDIMAEAIVRLEEAMYYVILTVHDEVVCEVDKCFGSLADLISILITLPGWATGLPVSAEGWEGDRYRK